MKIVKKINNNVAICVDGNGNDLIAFGKGIGFPEMPYELEDLSKISMTFYRIDKSFYNLMAEIPEDIFHISAMIVEEAKNTLNCSLNPNLVISLADHINFAIIRLKKYKVMKMLFSYDIEKLYPKETELGRFAVKLIEKELGYYFPESEITNIAIHFVNAEEETNDEVEGIDAEAIISGAVQKVEDFFSITIDKKSFKYNRFIMHLRYFITRVQQKEQFANENGDLMEAMKIKDPKIYECTRVVGSYIDKKLNSKTTEDELLYLMIHIKRILNER